MAKNVIKESAIVVLILLVVALLLGILFYDYIPMNKTVPYKVEAYKISNELEEELGKEVLEDQTIVKTYTVDSADLELYQKENDYDIGKKNPFSTVGTETITITDNNNENGNGQSSSNTVKDNQANINTTK
ncbi:MAG: hypothetical protein IJB90_03480 [Clostridia bacterium]|nr:hypothetical protein [Clostridia bacterium]